MASRETAFLAAFPALQRVSEASEHLRCLLDECTRRREWGPDTGDIPLLSAACDRLTMALAADEVLTIGSRLPTSKPEANNIRAASVDNDTLLIEVVLSPTKQPRI